MLPTPLALPCLLALVSLLTLPSLLVSASLLQGSHSRTETRMRGERVRRKIASRDGRAVGVEEEAKL